MKKSISIILCMCMIFACTVTSFATATSWDTTDQANLQAIKNTLTGSGSTTLKTIISNIAGYLVFSNKGVANWCSDIYDSLFNLFQINDADVGRKSITYWMREAVLDLDTLTGSNGQLSYLSQIYGALVYNSGNTTYSWLYTIDDRLFNILNRTITLGTYLSNIQNSSANIDTYTQNNLPGIYAYSSNISSLSSSYLPKLETLEQALINYKPGDSWSDVTNTSVRLFAHRQLITNNSTGEYTHMNITGTGGTNTGTRKWGLGTPLGNLALILEGINSNFVNAYTFENGSFDSNRNYVNWQTLTSGTRNPTSAINGIYNWLADIQIPIARLAYVYASDFEIAARDKAQANETAVVNNFIDSNGSGSAGVSDITAISGLSSGVKSNITTDASPSGIWDIFNSSHGTWFSQETYNQLDTTVQTRGFSFETPLLDQQISEIYQIIGGDDNK